MTHFKKELKKIFDWLKIIITFKINKTHLKYEKKKGKVMFGTLNEDYFRNNNVYY